MAIRNCEEIGENLQIIFKRLKANHRLLQLLYNTDKDPCNYISSRDSELDKIADELETGAEYWDNIWRDKIYEKLIKVTPRFNPQETARSSISFEVIKGSTNEENGEFRDVMIAVHIIIPLTQWVIKETNLRPFAIMGEIQKSLNGKKINGLGKIIGGDFEVNFLTDEVSCYVQKFWLTTYD